MGGRGAKIAIGSAGGQKMIEPVEAKPKVTEEIEKKPKSKKPGSKTEQLKQELIEYYKHLINVDISDKVVETTRRFGGGVIIRWAELNRNERNAIEYANKRYGNKYETMDYSGFKNGVMEQMLIKRK